MGGGEDIKETPQQRALTDHALQQLDDYRQRWLPVQKNLAATVEAMGKPGSVEQKLAEGKTSNDVATKFANAQTGLQSSLANKTGIGSSRSKLAISGLGDDEAKSKGLGLTATDQHIQDAYTASLGNLAAIGRGEKATVSNSLAQQATMSGQQASTDAAVSLANRESNAQLGGQLAGFGLQQAMRGFGSKAPPIVQGSNPNGMNGTMNNPSAYVNA